MRSAFIFLVGLVFGSIHAQATTLNFANFEPGVNEKTLEFPEAAISESNGGALFVYGKAEVGMPAGPEVCALQTGFTCTGDISLLFIGPVSNLAFKGFYAAGSDKAAISVYSDDFLVSFALISGNSSGQVSIDFSGVSGITRVEISDISAPLSKGIAYGGFSFDIDEKGEPKPAFDPPSILQFDSFPRGVNLGLLDIGPAILRGVNGGNIFVYKSGDFGMAPNGGFCAYTAADNCMGDFMLEFDRPIYDLMFSGFFAKPTDSVFVSLFDGSELLYSGTFFGTEAGMVRFDFRSFSSLTKLLFQDSSDATTKGMAFGDFRYRQYNELPAAVPIPPSWLLLFAGLFMMSLIRLRATAPISGARVNDRVRKRML